MSSAMSRIHPPSRPTAGSSSTRADTRSGRSRRASKPLRRRTNARRPPSVASSSAASDATLASIVHGAAQDERPWPSRSGAATANSVKCRVARRLPPLPVPGEPVDGQDLYRSRRAVAVRTDRSRHRCYGLRAHVARWRSHDLRHAAARRRSALTGCGLVGPPWCHFAHVRTAHRSDTDSAHPTRNARRGASDRWSGHRQEHAADPGRFRAHRRRDRSGIGSAADGFGAARHAGARRHHVGTARSRHPRGCPRTLGPHGALVCIRSVASRRAAQG